MHLASLPDDARVWLFASNRALSKDEQTVVLAQTRAFLGEWTSHGRRVPGEAEVLHERVLAVGALLTEGDLNAGVSGCGIDSLIHAVEHVAAGLGVNWTGALDVSYFDADGVLQTVSRGEFRQLDQKGVLTPESFVLDVTATTLGELRSQGLKRRVADAWHSRLLSAVSSVE